MSPYFFKPSSKILKATDLSCVGGNKSMFVRSISATPYLHLTYNDVYLPCCSSTPSVLPSRTHGDACVNPLWPFWRWCDLIWSPRPSLQTSCTECRPVWGQCPQWPAVCYRCCGPSRTSCDSTREKIYSDQSLRGPMTVCISKATEHSLLHSLQTKSTAACSSSEESQWHVRKC